MSWRTGLKRSLHFSAHVLRRALSAACGASSSVVVSVASGCGLIGPRSDRIHLRDRAAGRAIRGIHAREFERPPVVVAAAGVELRSVIGEGEQMSSKQLFEARPCGVKLPLALFEPGKVFFERYSSTGDGTLLPVFGVSDLTEDIDASIADLKGRYPGIIGTAWFIHDRVQGKILAAEYAAGLRQ